MQTLLASLIVLLIFILADIFFRFVKIQNEYSRKLLHLGVAVVIFALPYFISRELIIVLMLVHLVLLILTRVFGLSRGIHGVTRQTWGQYLFPISVALAAYWFLPGNLKAFQFGILVLGLSDTMAELFGVHFGRHRISFRQSKTWQGSLAFFLTSVMIYFVLIGPHLFPAVTIALILTLVEMIFSFGFDNLFLPLVGAWLIVLFK